MPSEDPLARSLAALSNFFVGESTLKETLDRVAHLAQEALPAADMAGLTMLVDGRARTAVFTNDDAPEIDSAQYETGIGPCLDAFRHQEVFRIDDTTKDAPLPPSATRTSRWASATPPRPRSCWPTPRRTGTPIS